MLTYAPSEYVGRPAPENSPRKFYSLLRDEDLMQVHSHAFNIMLGRDLRRNVHYSYQIAFELADGGKRVFYVNTYAGEELMRTCVASAAAAARDDAARGAIDARLRIADVPTGELSADWLMIQMKDFDVLVINSFEYAAMTRSHKDKVTRKLIELQRKFKATVVLFSHEMKRDLAAGFGSRGPLGTLAPFALAVSRIGDEWRTIAKSTAAKGGIKGFGTETPPQHPENTDVLGNIHEQQMLRAEGDGQSPAQDPPRRQPFNRRRMPKLFGGQSPNPSINIENDRGVSYHYGDFWEDPFHRGPYQRYDGRTMALYARTPLLHQYFLDNPDRIFSLGNTPNEAALAARLQEQTAGSKPATESAVSTAESGSVEQGLCVVESPQKH